VPVINNYVCSSSNNINSRRQRSADICELSMAVAKTGGKLIRDEKDFATFVLMEEKNDDEDDDESVIKPVMVFFTAPWCGPCRLSIPVVKEVMQEYRDRVEFVEVCTDDLPEVAADACVVSIPTIQMYIAGDLVDTVVGAVSSNVLASVVDKVLEEALELSPPPPSETAKGTENSNNRVE